MSEFKEKLKHLLNQKEQKYDIIFNSSLLKINKKIKRENSTKLFLSNINFSKCSKNLTKNNFNLNIYSFKDIKKCKSTTNLLTIMRSFSLYDIHYSNNNQLKKYDNFKRNSYSYRIKNYKSKIDRKNKYINSAINNPFKIYMNNIKEHNNIINKSSNNQNNIINYKENMSLNNINKNMFYKKDIKNCFRRGNKMNYNHNTSFLKNDIFIK